MASADVWNRSTAEFSPAWLEGDAPSSDVCLSTRTRIMRNLAGCRFPHRASLAELRKTAAVVRRVAAAAGLSAVEGCGPADRDALLAGRLISPDFGLGQPCRSLMLDAARRISLMIHEEDHIRLQALTGGWSIDAARNLAYAVLEQLEDHLQFAWSPRFGYLSASPYNCGVGVRHSAMFHLVALSQARRLPRVLRALDAMGVVSRGLFGESSRAIGAFVQVSVVSEELAPLLAAAEVVMAEERAERAAVSASDFEAKLGEIVRFAVASRTIGLADAMRVLAWVRWGASVGAPGCPRSPRTVDGWLTRLEVRSGTETSADARARAVMLRGWLESGGAASAR